ncbi:MAG: PHP domain-containing protein [Melioribacteraceae bacterium]|nr:PHP domain-containing protein [Melioribacteraceae bacterium]MCF8354608.1 PHP domain-containing protein [Melioribacteraceae bacterium]MCF8396365.1 PHP domain-containing protein [Melioribacteraceae bacterium]MCF8420185.1 PHP domain-containing protein [Melioribacteraceae bacterium]
MKSNILKIFFVANLILCLNLQAQFGSRKEVKIPDILGMKTLKCDFHMHTIFSDGNVWPTIRPEEAWREGLDVIAITDHIEYQPHKNDVPTNHNRAYELAKNKAEELGLTIIKGSEITRSMPPGHMNAIFINDASKLDTENWKDAVLEAKNQGAFVFWNHPGWRGQQKDGIARWYDEHTYLFENEIAFGIEVVNEDEFYPEVLQWCIDKNLTMLSNSDVHHPTNIVYDVTSGEHRPMTLVFAPDNSYESIKDALINHRTVCYTKDLLIGNEEYLTEIFSNSIEIFNDDFEISGKDGKNIQIKNNSDIPYKMKLISKPDNLEVAEQFTCYANRTVLLYVKNVDEEIVGQKDYELKYYVENLITSPGKAAEAVINVKINHSSSQK